MTLVLCISVHHFWDDPLSDLQCFEVIPKWFTNVLRWSLCDLPIRFEVIPKWLTNGESQLLSGNVWGELHNVRLFVLQGALRLIQFQFTEVPAGSVPTQSINYKSLSGSPFRNRIQWGFQTDVAILCCRIFTKQCCTIIVRISLIKTFLTIC